MLRRTALALAEPIGLPSIGALIPFIDRSARAENGYNGPNWTNSGPKERAMVEEIRNDEHDLASAIMEGARRRPVQSFGSYFGDDGSSCALGAAYDGVYHLPNKAVDHTTHPRRMDWLFDCLENVVKRCPEGCRKVIPLGAMIVHLNDDHHWTRERVAEWLRGDGNPRNGKR